MAERDSNHGRKSKGPKQIQAEAEEIEFRDYPRITPGEYPAYCKWGKIYRDGGFRRWVCLLRWFILSNDLFSVIATLPQFFSLGDGEEPHASRRGKFLPEWVRANGGPPSRIDRLPLKVFLRRCARVLVADVKSEVPYSTVRKIISWETGFQGHSVNKSHSQGRHQETHEERTDCSGALSVSSASALARVEGAITPTLTQGAGSPSRCARQWHPADDIGSESNFADWFEYDGTTHDDS